MPTTAVDDAFRKVSELVNRFRANESECLSPGYQEAELRQQYLDEFFMALGWDVRHQRVVNFLEREVRIERGVAVGLARKKADYAFFVAPNFRDPRLMVEAKKPSRALTNADDYFQTIRYGWSRGNPLAVLTDFQELHVLDCRFKPDIATALNRKVKSFHHLEYLDRGKFAEMYSLLSREAVVGGWLEKFAETLPKPRGVKGQRKLFPGGYLKVDEAFLEDLDGYRQSLAKAFKSKNPDLDSETLTEITQRSLDRLVFMRFFEDKLIEPEHVVAKFAERDTPWRDFVAASRRLDGVYNGIIFKRHAIIDRDNLGIDEDAFATICRELSHAHSPYDFDSIPIHILGSIYERFLGNVIVATAKQVRVEQKPEVRKAGGVYYTPDYIVQYIVANTVGKLIEDKTPAEIAELRFADIACGSGSFLLGVYDLLLRYHAKWYNDNPSKAKKRDCVSRDGVLFLSLEKKRQILLNNIYGVDIDPQAVEVTQLSLYLKLLEEETVGSIHGFQQEYTQKELHTTVLPSLDKNIVCGNSLIGRDILNGQGELFDPEHERQLNPMNFDGAFPEVIKQGGFDAVVGNPPYGRLVNNGVAEKYLAERLRSYQSVRDVYAAFIEKGLSLLRSDGMLSFIVPTAWLGGVSYRKLREVLCGFAMDRVVCLPFDVFVDAYIDTLIFVARNQKPASGHIVLGYVYPKRQKLERVEINDPEWTRIRFSAWEQSEEKKFVLSGGSLELIGKLRRALGTRVGDFVEMRRGVLFDQSLLKGRKTSDKSHRYFEGDVYRYRINYEMKHWVEFGPKMKEFPREFKWFKGPRVLLRRLVNRKQRLMAAFTDRTFITNKNLYSLLQQPDRELPEKYELFLLGILNSRLISRLYVDQVSQATKDDFPQVTIKDMLDLPMPPPAEKARHDRMVSLVEQMLAAAQALAIAKTDKKRNFFQDKSAHLDREIDKLVYELYGLTEEEIGIVEGSCG